MLGRDEWKPEEQGAQCRAECDIREFIGDVRSRDPEIHIDDDHSHDADRLSIPDIEKLLLGLPAIQNAPSRIDQ